MSMLLKDVIGFSKQVETSPVDPDLPLADQYIGVEVEVEGAARTSVNNRHWDEKHDGSLRDNGKEFVFSAPLYNMQIKNALDNLQLAFDKNPPSISERCSVHVHLNVSDISTIQLHRMLVLYLIFERTLVKYHRDRENNVFAIPFYKAPMYVHQIGSLYREDFDGIHEIFRTMNKYQALNLLTLRTFGTVEFRHMGGTTNTEEIYEWIKIILMIKKYAINNDFNPMDLLHGISGRGPEVFLFEVFGDLAPTLFYNDIADDITKGIRLAQYITLHDDLVEVDRHYRTQRFSPYMSKWISEFIHTEDPDEHEEEDEQDEGARRKEVPRVVRNPFNVNNVGLAGIRQRANEFEGRNVDFVFEPEE